MALSPPIGFGLGLRPEHYEDFLSRPLPVDWLEIISENYMDIGGRPYRNIKTIRETYPMVMHGVSLSIGSVSPLDFDYLKKLKTLANDIEALWISDHLCFTGMNQINLHDLLPLPYTEEALKHVSERVNIVQDYLGQQILLENASTYVAYKASTIDEAEFLKRLCDEADCLLLLDVNNVYVNAVNHGIDAFKYIDTLPHERIQQIHLAGHDNRGTHIVDTHDDTVIKDVWQLYDYAMKTIGFRSTMIERDANIPPIDELIKELDIARGIVKKIKSEEEVAA